MSVQAVASLLPLTPGGAGAQQALLVATLVGPGPIAVLTYSVGQQIAIAVWTGILGFIALAFVFRTTDWRTPDPLGRGRRRQAGPARVGLSRRRPGPASATAAPRRAGNRAWFRPASVSRGTRAGTSSRFRRIADAASISAGPASTSASSHPRPGR